MPCNECAKSIIQRGIKKVICYEPDREDTFNWEITELMFAESGVSIYRVKKEND
jgi:deoxycytidylate deaminase